MPIVHVDQMTIHYERTTKPNIHYVKIYLDPLHGVQVTAAATRDQIHIESFIKKKAAWIKDKWQSAHESMYSIDHLTPESGQRIPYLGRSYQLFIQESNDHQANFFFHKGKFYFSYPPALKEADRGPQLIKLVHEWLYNKAQKKFSLLHDHPVDVEADHTRLGYQGHDQILLNWRLVQSSKHHIQQIIENILQ